MQQQKIKVSLVDDHALFRRGVADIIQHSHEYCVLAEYPSGQAFLQQWKSQYPDILLLDVQMPHESGLEILKIIRKTDQRLKVIMLTACEDADVLMSALQFGANGFMPKDVLPETILENLHQVCKGQTILHNRGINVLAQQLRNTPTNIDQQSTLASIEVKPSEDLSILNGLTSREKDTLFLIAKGLNNKLIARELGISDGTVKVYVKNLLWKLNVSSRLEISVWAHEHLQLSMRTLN